MGNRNFEFFFDVLFVGVPIFFPDDVKSPVILAKGDTGEPDEKHIEAASDLTSLTGRTGRTGLTGGWSERNPGYQTSTGEKEIVAREGAVKSIRQ